MSKDIKISKRTHRCTPRGTCFLSDLFFDFFFQFPHFFQYFFSVLFCFFFFHVFFLVEKRDCLTRSTVTTVTCMRADEMKIYSPALQTYSFERGSVATYTSIVCMDKWSYTFFVMCNCRLDWRNWMRVLNKPGSKRQIQAQNVSVNADENRKRWS